MSGSAVRVALCGLGSAAGRAHLPALQRAAARGDAVLVGLCDPDPQRCAQWEEEIPGTRAGTDLASVLDATAPDLLVVASPPSTHLGAIRLAALREIDVVCEKPLGLTHADVDELERIHTDHPALVVVPVHQYRHAAAWRALAARLRRAAAAGEPFSLHCVVERPGTDPLSAGGWRAQTAREGGILGDHAVHYLALAWSLGAPLAVEDCLRDGDGTRESATLALRCGPGTVTIAVSYAGTERCNRLTATADGDRLEIDWCNGGLRLVRCGNPGVVRAVGGLDSRPYVNQLYVPLYDEALAALRDPEWRAARVDETLGVARLLAESFAAAARHPRAAIA